MLAEKAQTLVENNGKFPDAFVVPMDECDEFHKAFGRRVHTSLAVSDHTLKPTWRVLPMNHT